MPPFAAVSEDDYGLIFTAWGFDGFMLVLLAGAVYDATKRFKFPRRKTAVVENTPKNRAVTKDGSYAFTPQARLARSSTSAAFSRARAAPSARI